MIDQISNDMLLQQMEQMRNSVGGAENQPDGGRVDQEFGEVLGKLIDDVDKAQQEADVSIQQLASGDATSLQDVVMKMEQAEVSFQLMKEIRNKLLEAYKEVMSMQT